MPIKSPRYNFDMKQYGDRVYYDTDQSNMYTVENEISGLMGFIGNGVINGWDVVFMGLIGNTATDNETIQYRLSLFNAAPKTSESVQYKLLGGNTNLVILDNNGNVTYDDNGVPIWNEESWNLVVRVTPGNGIIKLLAVETRITYYFIYPKIADFYYVWAVNTASSATQQIANIISPPTPQSDYDSFASAIYLAQVEVIQNYNSIGNPIPNSFKINLPITYGDRRQTLKNLSGALNKDLKNLIQGHVHLGGANHPSKILLTTELILTAKAPIGSTIFLLYRDDNTLFTDTPDNYGHPSVLLNNIVLDEKSYVLNLQSGKLSLKNSLKTGSILQIILPLSPQKILTVASNSSFTSPSGSMYLTDGTTSTQNGVTIDNIFTWDVTIWDIPVVQVNDGTGNFVTINPNNYFINPTIGSLTFKNAYTSGDNSYLKVTLTKLGKQIEDKLSGKRIKDIDASSFTFGILNPSRLSKLSHVGERRYKNIAVLRPTLRLLSDGDHYTYYPEIINSDLQYNSTIYTINNSINITTPGNILLGTKHGLMISNDISTPSINLDSTWNIDSGEICYIQDELHMATFENHFHTTVALTNQNHVYYTTDLGISWNNLKLPNIPINPTNIINVKALSLYVGSHFTELEKPSGLVVRTWYHDYFLGSDYGVWTLSPSPQEGIAVANWIWSRSNFWQLNPLKIYSLIGIGTAHVVTATDENGNGTSKTTYDYTRYVGSEWGVMLGENGGYGTITTRPVKGIAWIQQGIDIPQSYANMHNNIMWWTDHETYITHSSWHFANQTVDANTTVDYWVHPLSDLYSKINSYNVTRVQAATVSDNITSFTYNNISIIDGYTLKHNDYVLVKNQNVNTENDIYIVNAINPNTPWTKVNPTIYNIQVVNGDINATSIWTCAVNGHTWTRQFPDNIIDVASDINLINNNNPTVWPPTSFSPVIDGVLNYTTVLLSFQDDVTQNGIYSVNAGNWTKISPSAPPTNTQWIRISYGNRYSCSVWRVFSIAAANAYGVSNNKYLPTLYISRIINDLNHTIKQYVPRPNTNEYWILSSHGAYRALDTIDSNGHWRGPTVFSPNWWDYQGNSFCMYYFSAKSGPLIGVERYFVGSDKGLWMGFLDENSNINWTRTNNVFLYDDSVQSTIPRPTLYDQFTGKLLINQNSFTVNATAQSFTFASEQPPYNNFLCEKDYMDYYVSPWLDSADIPTDNGTSIHVDTETIVYNYY